MTAEQSESSFPLRITHAVCRLYARLYHRLDVVRYERLPRTGPAILVCNHTSGLDALLIQAVVQRKIAWMVAREFYDIKATRWVYDLQQSIPVDRNGKDTAALRAAMRRLADGHVLGVFPQGAIVTAGPLKLQSGIGLIAQRSQAFVYPVAITGTTEGTTMTEVFNLPQRCRIAFGPPLHDFAAARVRESVEASTARIATAMSESMRLIRQ